jgi:hypothetical protein
VATGEAGLGYDATGAGLSGQPPPAERPASEMVEPAASRVIEPAASRRAEATGGWAATGDGEWQLSSTDGTEHAVVRAVGREFEARVYRYRTGPGEPNPFLANGPQVFETVDEAIAYCESNMAPLPGRDVPAGPG